jgi:hypothetical protein
MLYHNSRCHFTADRNAGLLDADNQIFTVFTYHRYESAHDKSQIFQMLFDGRLAAYFFDYIPLTDVRQSKRHHSPAFPHS